MSDWSKERETERSEAQYGPWMKQPCPQVLTKDITVYRAVSCVCAEKPEPRLKKDILPFFLFHHEKCAATEMIKY